jgi:CrcB protein
MTVNLLGCLAMGVLVVVLAQRFDASNELRLFLATGILGGFTTFSASRSTSPSCGSAARPSALLPTRWPVSSVRAAGFVGLRLARHFA